MKLRITTRPVALFLLTVFLRLPLHGTMQAVDTPDNGNVSEGTFTSRFFGFSYKIPQGLTPQRNSGFKKHVDNLSGPRVSTFILLVAATLVKPYKNVVIKAERVVGLQNGASYLQKVSSSAMKNGLSVLGSPEQKILAGNKTFFRQDYYSPQGEFFQTQVCTLSKGYALDFVISAKTREDIDQLFDSLNAIEFVAERE